MTPIHAATVSIHAHKPTIPNFSLFAQQAVDWAADNLVTAAIATGIGALIVIALLGARSLGIKLCRRDKTGTGWPSIFGHAIARTRIWFLIPLAAMLVDGYADPPPLVSRTIHFLFTITAALQSALWMREFLLGVIEYRAGARDDPGRLGSALGLIRVFVSFALFAIAIVLILDNLGVNVTGLVAGLGIGGIAIGLAAQGIFSDLFAALAIIFDRPFRVGDTIKFGDATGTVIAIGMKTVRVRSVDGEEVIVSNAKLLDQQLRNLSNFSRRRVLLNVQMLYRNDPAVLPQLPDAIKAIVEAEPHCSFVHAWVTDTTVVGLNMEVLFNIDTSDAEVMNQARHNVIAKIMAEFKSRKIEMAYQATLPPA